MATKDQYDFFRALHEAEELRYTQLEARARAYLSIVSIFVGAFLLKAQELKASAQALRVQWPMMLAVAVLLALSLMFVVLALAIRTYEGIASPSEIIEGYGPQPPSDDDFFDSRIADLSVATERNSEVNERVARRLACSVASLAAAVLLLLTVLLFAMRPERDHEEQDRNKSAARQADCVVDCVQRAASGL